MRVGLTEFQSATDVEQGKITGPDGRSYSRRGTKAKRTHGDELIATGASLILEMYSSGQFEWLDGQDARNVWEEVRPYVTRSDPTAKQLAKHTMWTLGIWECDDGTTVLHLTGHC